MFNIVIGAVIGILICSLCASNKINDLYIETIIYYAEWRSYKMRLQTMLTAKSTINKKYATVFVTIDRKTRIAYINERGYRALKNKLIHWEFDNEELRALEIFKIEYN